MRTAATALLDNALRRARYNQRAAAKLLGLTYHQFRGLYRKRRQDLDRTAPDDGER
jgi:psp operon transcriptional activator